MRKILILIVLGLFVFAGCGSDATFTNIGRAEYEEMVATPDEYVFVDVRTPEEFAVDGISDVFINADSSEAASYIESNYELTDKIVLVCRSGNRSSTVAKQLVDAGFENVYNIEGGLQTIK